MKTIDIYITEKLRINKDTETDELLTNSSSKRKQSIYVKEKCIIDLAKKINQFPGPVGEVVDEYINKYCRTEKIVYRSDIIKLFYNDFGTLKKPTDLGKCIFDGNPDDVYKRISKFKHGGFWATLLLKYLEEFCICVCVRKILKDNEGIKVDEAEDVVNEVIDDIKEFKKK